MRGRYLRRVRAVAVWCDGRCSATALVCRLLGDCWLCATCGWVSCLVPSALCIWIVFLGKFCEPSLVHVAPCPICPAPFLAAAAEPRNVTIEVVLNLPKLDLSVTVAVLQLERVMSCDAVPLCPPDGVVRQRRGLF